MWWKSEAKQLPFGLYSSCNYTKKSSVSVTMTGWLCHFCYFMCAGWTEAPLWAALEEKCNGVTLSVQGGKPWIMWDESEPERRIRVSQWVTRRWGCLLPWVQEKFSCIALGKLGRQGWGRKKELGGRDWWEHGGKGQISWKEEPKLRVRT